MSDRTALTDAFGEALLELGTRDSRIVAIDADVGKRMGTKGFATRYPERYFNVGIAEQNLIGVGAGLASVGKVAFVGTFAIFVTGRCWDELRQAVAYPRLNVKVIGAHGGISVGEDGATHQAGEDIAIVRALPNFKILAPCDPVETKQAVALALETDGPVYIRLARPALPVIVGPEYRLQLGKAATLRQGSHLTLAACGIMVEKSLEAAEALQSEGIQARVLNMSSIKPIDKEAILAAATETAGIVTVEDHSVIGGLGAAVAEVLAEAGTGKLKRVGIPDCFCESGDSEGVLAKYGLDVPAIIDAAKGLLAGRCRA